MGDILANEHGFVSNDIHSKCDGHANTSTIIEAKESSYIFGCYTSVAWETKSNFKKDADAFIFSLVNQVNKPLKMNASLANCAICCSPNFGPKFGGDITISEMSNSIKSWSNLGYSYTHPQFEFECFEAKSFLAGSFCFTVRDIEVFSRK